MTFTILTSGIAHSERTLICVPCAAFRATEHPIREVRTMFPMAYAHFRAHAQDYRREIKPDFILGRGKILFSDFDKQKICWMPVQNRHENYFQIEWISDAIDEIVKQGLHEKFDLAFPALGYYDEDGVEMDDVLKMVYTSLFTGENVVDYHLKY